MLSVISFSQAVTLLVLANLCLVIQAQIGIDSGPRYQASSKFHRPGAIPAAISVLLGALCIVTQIPVLFLGTTPWARVTILTASLGVPLLCGLYILLLGSAKRRGVFEELHDVQRNGAGVAYDPRPVDPSSQTALVADVNTNWHRFIGKAKDLVIGSPEDAAHGIFSFIQANEVCPCPCFLKRSDP